MCITHVHDAKHTRARTHTYAHTHMHIRAQTHTHVHTRTHTYAHTHARTHAHTHTHRADGSYHSLVRPMVAILRQPLKESHHAHLTSTHKLLSLVSSSNQHNCTGAMRQLSTNRIQNSLLYTCSVR